MALKPIDPTTILTHPEVEAIVAAANTDRDQALLAVLYECGVRKHEVLAVKRKHLRPRGDGKRGFMLYFERSNSAAAPGWSPRTTTP